MNRLGLLLFLFAWPALGATYYTSHDAGGAGVGTLGDPFTLQQAADTAVGNDLVLVKNTGTYAPAATIDFDTNAGASGSRITFRGANSDGSDDGTQATISGSGQTAGTDILNPGITNLYLKFENLTFTAAKRCVYTEDLTHDVFLAAINCKFQNATSHGIDDQDNGGIKDYYLCEFSGSGGSGVLSVTNRSNTTYEKCSFHDNTGDGVYCGLFTRPRFLDCLFYDNGDDGLVYDVSSNTISLYLSGCTFYGNTGDGVLMDALEEDIIITGCIFQGNGGYGINLAGNTTYLSLSGNAFYGNTSGNIDVFSGVVPGTQVLEDANFVSVVDGSENFTPQNDNLILSRDTGAGTTYAWIGAIQPQASGGGFFHPFDSVVFGR